MKVRKLAKLHARLSYEDCRPRWSSLKSALEEFERYIANAREAMAINGFHQQLYHQLCEQTGMRGDDIRRVAVWGPNSRATFLHPRNVGKSVPLLDPSYRSGGGFTPEEIRRHYGIKDELGL